MNSTDFARILKSEDPPHFNHESTRRALQGVLWNELSLSLARQAIVLVDTVAKFGAMTIASHPDASGRNIQVMISTNSADAIEINKVLGTLPQSTVLSIGNHELDIMIGEPAEPHVVVMIRY